MLAKAVATEAGANFINISMSSITSKVFNANNVGKCIFLCGAFTWKLNHSSVFICSGLVKERNMSKLCSPLLVKFLLV